MVLENGHLWNSSTFLNETFRRASSLRLIENECIVDGYCPLLMPATPIFQKLTFSKKVLKTNKFWTFPKLFFFISGCNLIELFNGTLFVLILSVVIERHRRKHCCPVSIGHHCNWSSTAPEILIKKYQKQRSSKRALEDFVNFGWSQP